MLVVVLLQELIVFSLQVKILLSPWVCYLVMTCYDHHDESTV